MTGFQDVNSADEAQNILRILSATVSADAQESRANVETFGRTLNAIFAHDLECPSGERWLDADCVQIIGDIAQRAPDPDLRLAATDRLGYVGIREAHTETSLANLNNILNNRQELLSVRWTALKTLDFLDRDRKAVAQTFARTVADASDDVKLRILAAEHLVRSHGKTHLDHFLTEESVQGLANVLKNEEKEPEVRDLVAQLLKFVREDNDSAGAIIEPVSTLIEQFRPE